jgi:tetratricopeptide (TPR) repeat protein
LKPSPEVHQRTERWPPCVPAKYLRRSPCPPASFTTRQSGRNAIRRSLEIQPEYAAAQSNLGTLLLLEGNAAEALVTFRQISSESSRLSGIAIAEHTLGHREESQRALDELVEKHSPDSAFLIAETYAWRGDKEQAFAWLERAYERHESSFFNLKSEPRFASLLGDPRYHALLRKLNLPE